MAAGAAVTAEAVAATAAVTDRAAPGTVVRWPRRSYHRDVRPRGCLLQPSDFFSATYAEARRRFLDAAAQAGFASEHHANPAKGPDGGALATDVVRIGPADAPRVLLTLSATHGVEGFCGSGAQVGTLRAGLWRDLPADTALVMVHAINPYGFAWLRRVTEDNVDLNRNHVDHDAPYPQNPGYVALREHICPRAWDDAARAEATRNLHAYADEHGWMALQQAISGGQHVDPTGVFFGGTAPTWSARTLYRIVEQHAAGADHVAVIDYHTGLGPYGYGELIGDGPAGDPGRERLKHWLGDEVTATDDGSSTSAPLTGCNDVGIRNHLPSGTSLTMVTLEYGTSPVEEVLDSLRADAWLHAHGDLASGQGKAIKAEIRRCFYPDADDWKAMVWERAVETQAKMLAGLASL